MTLKRRTGGDSYIFIGRQKNYGEHITGADVFNGPDPANNKDFFAKTEPNLIRRRFPFVRNTLDPTSETAESESLTGANAAVPQIITSRSGGGEWEFEVLPGDAIHLLLGWFNPGILPVSSDISDLTIPTGKVSVSGTKLVVDNADGTAISDWPGQLKFEGDLGLTGAGKVVINGEQRRSRSNNFNAQTFETIDIADASDVDVTSKKFYRLIHDLDFIGFTGTTVTKPSAIKIDKDTKSTELTLHPQSALFAGWSSQMVKASEPFIAYDIIPDSFRLTVSAGSMRLVLTLLASFVQEGRLLTAPLHIAYQLPIDNSESTARKILDVYGYDTLDFYPSYGTAVALGEPGQTLDDLRTAVENGTAHITPITSIETVGSHNYTNAEGFTGDPVGGQPVTDENQTRTVNVNATVVHETDTSDTNNKTTFW